MVRQQTGLVLCLCLYAAPGLTADFFGDRSLLQALAAMRQGDDATALAHIRVSLSVPKNNEIYEESRLLAARTAVSTGQCESALTDLEGLEAALPEVVDLILVTRAATARCRGEWREALTLWQKLTTGFPSSPFLEGVHYSIADAYYALGKNNEARAAYQSAVANCYRCREASTARFNIARIDESAHRWTDAASGYADIAYERTTDPFNELALARLSQLIATGRARPPSFQQRMDRIDRLIVARKLTLAQKEIEATRPDATTRSRQVSVKFRRAQLAYAQRDYDRATVLYGELVQESTGWRRRYYEQRVARCYSASDQVDRAVAAYERLANRYRNESDGRTALFKAAWLAYNGRRHQKAVALFRLFLDRYPSDSAAGDATWYLAWNLYRLGDVPHALSMLRRVQQRYPRSGDIQRSLYWQGRLSWELGRVESARESWRAARQYQPLSYYALLARQQLRTRGLDPDGGGPKPVLLASLDDEPLAPVEENSREPSPEELPEDGGFKPLSSIQLPWGGSVMDWDNPSGRRALRLIRLGLPQHAAALVRRLPDARLVEKDTALYGRARVLFALGDFNGAYRLARSVLRGQMYDLPTPETERHFHFAYPAAYADLVDRSAREFGVSPFVLLAIMRQESAFLRHARSWANAQGLMQVIPPTGHRIAAALGVEPFSSGMLHRPEINIRFGAWYISALVTKYHGNIPLALASYNAGPKAVCRWVDTADGMATDEFVEEIPYRETRHYVKKVLGNLMAYNLLYGEGTQQISQSLPTGYLNNVNF